MSFARAGIDAESFSSGSKLLPASSGIHRRQLWQSTSALIVAETVGTGVLALGGSFSKLGWVAGISLLVASYVVCVFTSLLLSSVARCHPEVMTMGQAARKLLGPKSAVAGYTVLYIFLFVTLANYVIVLSDAVRSMLYAWPICRPWATLIGAALLLPSNQLRTLSSLTTLSVISFLTIIATIVICLWNLMAGSGNCTGEIVETGFVDFNAAICAFVFSYAGQSIMLEMQAEMKEPNHFPKAVVLSFTGLLFVYLLVGCACLWQCGRASPGELLDVLANGPAKAVAGVLMVVHLIVTYTILQQVLTRAACQAFLPAALWNGFGARCRWAAMSTSILAAAWVLANSVPAFSDLVNVAGGALLTQTAFTFPPLLYLAISRKALPESKPPMFRRCMNAACYVTLIMSAYCTIAGTVSSIVVMARHMHSTGGGFPFACKLS
jgi:amino acid permease